MYRQVTQPKMGKELEQTLLKRCTKGEESYDFTPLWDIKQKATMNKQNQQTHRQTKVWCLSERKRWGERVKGSNIC